MARTKFENKYVEGDVTKDSKHSIKFGCLPAVPFYAILLVLILLNATHVISIPWWWLIVPLLAGIVLSILVVVLMIVVIAFAAFASWRDQ